MLVFPISRTLKGVSTDATDRVKRMDGREWTPEEKALIAERNRDGRHPIG